MRSEKIGNRIKDYMGKQQLSTEDIAERTGLTTEFIGSLMEDDVYPSLGPLVKIARALGIRPGTLLDDQVTKDPLIIRQNERKEQLKTLPQKNAAVSHKFYSLGHGKSDRHMEPFFVEILPESSIEKNLSSHEGEEFIVVQTGELEIIYGKETHTLETGDSIYYNSIVPHYVSCKGGQPATIYAVLYFPD